MESISPTIDREVSGDLNPIQASHSGFPSGTASGSIGCWLKVNAFDANSCHAVIFYGRSIVSDGRGIVVCDQGGPGFVYTHWGANTSGGDVPTIGQWYHVICVDDEVSGLSKLYVDGELIASATHTFSTDISTEEFNIGSADVFRVTGKPFKGVIDEVAVWDVALTDDEIQILYNDGSGRRAVF